ncbi:hypothetical protein D3C81_2304100 [compost metagenome]
MINPLPVHDAQINQRQITHHLALAAYKRGDTLCCSSIPFRWRRNFCQAAQLHLQIQLLPGLLVGQKLGLGV